MRRNANSRKFWWAAIPMMLALGLGGCSSSESGPPEHLVKIDYVKWMFFNPNDTLTSKAQEREELPKVYRKMADYIKVQSCKRTDVGTWSCFVYIHNGRGQDTNRDILVLTHEGSHWSVAYSLSHPVTAG